jgi:hypothetical protein
MCFLFLIEASTPAVLLVCVYHLFLLLTFACFLLDLTFFFLVLELLWDELSEDDLAEEESSKGDGPEEERCQREVQPCLPHFLSSRHFSLCHLSVLLTLLSELNNSWSEEELDGSPFLGVVGGREVAFAFFFVLALVLLEFPNMAASW